ncbi:hypothetical protein C1H46_012062 [Malus baccata]|uniref:Phytocyanin domain-containing protein n=1 Tax=Malus baccata TaxID=106549 RepID=A0A540MVM2_MALBA|nr:hypothetical protein C1H46_012062 [Malus baccata]
MVSLMRLVGCFLLVAVALFGGAAADTYTVGDDLEWTIPLAGSIAYSTWANTEISD